MKKINLIITVSILLIACNAGVRWFVIGQQVMDIQSLQQRAFTLRKNNNLTFEMQVRQISRDRKSQIGELQKRVDMITAELPGVFSFPEYAVKIRSLIDQNHLSIASTLRFSPEKTRNRSLYVYSTSIAATGSYPAIKQFLADLQNLEGIKHLSGLTLTRVNRGSRRIKLTMKLGVFLRHDTL
ncbi:MAG: hypothetical protein D3926_07100 [Desulfobacteraceae bacterium]|nr:MAG: hypothetical protein D3926_07100 [Desulfobacteraceae bacterium]